MKLNIGCGKHKMPGFINIDMVQTEATDVVYKVGGAAEEDERTLGYRISEYLGVPFEAVPKAGLIIANHVLEHVSDPLAFMEELYDIAENDCIFMMALPHGASDDAFEDPTHVRQYFPGSFQYFSQLPYYNADYGYRGDWDVKKVELQIPKSVWAPSMKSRRVLGEIIGPPTDTEEEIKSSEWFTQSILENINIKRNQVKQMVVTLQAVKPARKPSKDPHQYQLALTYLEE